MNFRDTIKKMAEDSEKFLPVPECHCISCGRAIDRAALNLIWYYDEPDAKPLPGGIAKPIGRGSMTLVQFPICETCAPPCKKCDLPIRTRAVRQASQRVSRQLGRDVRGMPGCRHIHLPGSSLIAGIRRFFGWHRPVGKADAGPNWAEQRNSTDDLPLPKEILGTIMNLLEQDLANSAAGKVPERRLIPHHAIKRDIALRAFEIDFEKLNPRMQELNADDYEGKTNQIRRMDQHQLDGLIDAMRSERTDLLEIEDYVRSKNDRYKIVDPIFQRVPEKDRDLPQDPLPVSNVELPMERPDQGFKECWSAAVRHLQSQTHDAAINWLKADLNPPFLEHLSFRLGNQLFFVRIEDLGRRIRIPGALEGVKSIAEGCNGHACLMPMELKNGHWAPLKPGWGLIDASSREGIDPFLLVSDEKIEMTDWELHDFAVQVVRDYVRDKLGHQIMSSQGNPGVDPSIWFVGEGGPEWIVVRTVRCPERNAPLPANIHTTAESCSRIGKAGHFASVAVCSAEQGFGSQNSAAEPLWRGHGMHVHFEGLKRIQTPKEEQAIKARNDVSVDSDASEEARAWAQRIGQLRSNFLQSLVRVRDSRGEFATREDFHRAMLEARNFKGEALERELRRKTDWED